MAEFFKQKRGAGEGEATKPSYGQTSRSKPSTLDRLKAAGSSSQQKAQSAAAAQGINPGNYVRHDKYGRGLVLRREGNGDNAKLTVSFPGFGQKKLIEKYANLQKEE